MASSKSRNQLALEIQEGASNPYAIAHCLFDAIAEARHTGSPYDDPACRLMAHQLGHLFNVHQIMTSQNIYNELIQHCRDFPGQPLVRVAQPSIDAMRSIQNLLAGRQRDVEDLATIVDILRRHGYEVKEP